MIAATEDTHAASAEPAAPASVLIVGDWIVDDYWFLRPSDSPLASSTGLAHYEIASRPEHLIRDLCGAGHVANILFHSLTSDPSLEASDETRPTAIIGLGRWHRRDTELMRHLVHADRAGACPVATLGLALSVTADICDDPPPQHQLRLHTVSPDGPTMRVTRLYSWENEHVKQVGRVDLARAPADTPQRLGTDAIRDLLANVVAVVVHDMGKGTVTSPLIEQIRDGLDCERWYIRSKTQDPAWLGAIADRVKFLLVGPELLSMKNPLDTWLLDGRVTPQAMTTIAAIRVAAPDATVAILTHTRQLIARVPNQEDIEDPHCVTLDSAAPSTPAAELRWPSAVFASVVREQVVSSGPVTAETLERALGAASALSGIPSINVPQYMAKTLGSETGAADGGRGALAVAPARQSSWRDARDAWNQARADRGFIASPAAPRRLEVWRGEPVLPGYITCLDERQEIVLRLGGHLKEFVNTSAPTASFSMLLQADPGTGKTALAEALASAVGAQFLRFNITSMFRREDLFGVFDAVASFQALSGEPLVVFVDEINAHLESAAVFDAFLAPIEERKYVRHGLEFKLKPCAWIFAGTGGDEHSRSDKYSDFRSRLTTMEMIDYRSIMARYEAAPQSGETVKHQLSADRERVEHQTRLEHVYLGALLIHKKAPWVTRVTKEVLDAFYAFDPAGLLAPSRRIRTLVGLIRDVHDDWIDIGNCDRWDDDVYWSGDAEFIDLVF